MALFDRSFLARGACRPQALPCADPATERNLLALWDKYAGELKVLSAQLSVRYHDMQRRGLGAVFGDLEGELLYILIREAKPRLVYEISPNSGYSTNYLLSAVTRNGTGRVESFELIESFDGTPTAEVIRANMIDLCDPARHHLNIGDARVEALRRLDHGIPDFTLLDSCHDDFFAEFYVKALLPRLTGTVVIQDVLHCGPRPEWSGEAYYLLSWLYETGIPFLPFPFYEDLLNASAVRAGLTPRRTLRGSSIVLPLSDAPVGGREDGDRLVALIEAERQGAPPALDPRFPLNSTLGAPQLRRRFQDRTAPEDRYVAARYGLVLEEMAPGFCDITTLGALGLTPTPRMKESLVRGFDGADPFLQVSLLEVLALADGATPTNLDLFRRISPAGLAGTELTHRMAFVALRLNLRDAALAWIRACRRAGTDASLAVGFRALLQCARLAEFLKEPTLAEGLIDDVRALRNARAAAQGAGAVAKLERELTALCREIPRLAPLAGLA